MSDHTHDEELVEGAACPAPWTVRILRMPEDLTAALDAFLAEHLPGFETVDSIAITVETVEHVHDDLNGDHDRAERYYLVDHDNTLEGGFAALNDPKETE